MSKTLMSSKTKQIVCWLLARPEELLSLSLTVVKLISHHRQKLHSCETKSRSSARVRPNIRVRMMSCTNGYTCWKIGSQICSKRPKMRQPRQQMPTTKLLQRVVLLWPKVLLSAPLLRRSKPNTTNLLRTRWPYQRKISTYWGKKSASCLCTLSSRSLTTQPQWMVKKKSQTHLFIVVNCARSSKRQRMHCTSWRGAKAS